jgi:Chlorophyll A-B binding protein
MVRASHCFCLFLTTLAQMLAVVGWIVADFVRIPGDAYSFSNIPSSVEAHDILLKQDAVGGPMGQLCLFISLFDFVITCPAVVATMKGERKPGDFGLMQYAPKDADKYAKYELNELMNGRLAMMAIGGIATQSVLSGHGFPYV